MVQKASDGRSQGTHLQPVAGSECRRQRPVLGAHPKIAFPKDNSGKPSHLIQRAAARKAYFDAAAAGNMPPRKAGGQRGGVIGNHNIAGKWKVYEFGSRTMPNLPPVIGRQEQGIHRSLHGNTGGNHPTASPDAASTPATSSAS